MERDDDALRRDQARDRWLAAQGVRMVRFPASQVYQDIHGVMDHNLLTIDALRRGGTSERRLAPSTTRSSLRSAGGPPPAASRGR